MPAARRPARKSSSRPSDRDELMRLPLPFDVVTHSVNNLLRRFRPDAVRPLGPYNGYRPQAGPTTNRVENRGAMPVGLRHVLSADEGTGYWDFFQPMPHVMLSITDCTYRSLHPTQVPGEDVFKVRVLCSRLYQGKSEGVDRQREQSRHEIRHLTPTGSSTNCRLTGTRNVSQFRNSSRALIQEALADQELHHPDALTAFPGNRRQPPWAEPAAP
jgi:hypothetical protein